MASSHCTEREGTGSEGGAANDQVKAKKKKWQHKRTEYKIGKGLSHFLTRLDTHTHSTPNIHCFQTRSIRRMT